MTYRCFSRKSNPALKSLPSVTALADMRLARFVSFCWAVAGRTLVRELAFKQDSQDELGEATLKQEVSIYIYTRLLGLDTYLTQEPHPQISVILSAMRMFSQSKSLSRLSPKY